MSKKTCIICGKACEISYKLPYGEISCHNQCLEELNYLVNNSYPLVWASKEDLEDMEKFTEEELETITPEQFINAARNASDRMWDGFNETFGDAIKEIAQEIELGKVENTPRKELPLFMGNLKYRESERVFIKRMKEE